MNTVCITLDRERLSNIARLWSQFDLHFQYLAKWPLILTEAECNNVVLVHPFNYNADADIAKFILRSNCPAILQLMSVVAYSYFPEVTHAYKFEVEIGCDHQRAGRRMLAARAYLHYKWDRYAKGLALELKVKWPTSDRYLGNSKLVHVEHVVLASPKFVQVEHVVLASPSGSNFSPDTWWGQRRERVHGCPLCACLNKTRTPQPTAFGGEVAL
jgi:hypothetical protein